MNSILFLADDWPLTPDAAGGAGALNYSHLELLAHSGHPVDLVILTRDPDHRTFLTTYVDAQPEIWEQVRGWCRSHHLIHLGVQGRERAPLKHLLGALRDPQYLESSFSTATCHALQRIIDDTQPSIVWIEHYMPMQLAARLEIAAPMVYSHHDWNWRIKSHRHSSRGLGAAIRTFFAKRAEQALLHKADAIASGSITELDELRQMGFAKTVYLPTTYNQVSSDLDVPVPQRARIVHLGGMNTTANRLGLQRFMQIVWPALCDQLPTPPELWVIGSLDGTPPPLLASLKAAGAVMTGFVRDLSDTLRPFDIQIIPWEHNTGTRTRIPLALNYAQVVVAHREGAACAPELVHAVNSLIVDNLSQMPQAILSILDDPTRRVELGKAARQTFSQHFTRSALQPRLNDFLASLR